MTVMRWAPLEDVNYFKQELEQLLNPHTSATGQAGYTLNPPAEVVEAEQGYRVRLALPGLSSEKISEYVQIEATQKALTLTGELVAPPGDGLEKTLMSQFKYGKFLKQLAFPDGVGHENIEARYQDGILELWLPKLAASQKRNVQIQVKS